MLANNFGTFTEAQGFITNQYNMGDNDVIHSLPDDQWIKELEYWDSYAWAFHQIFITDHAIGPTVRAPLSEPFIIPAEGAELKLCNMQKMRKQGGFRYVAESNRETRERRRRADDKLISQ